MNINFINKVSIIIFLVFVISCQERLIFNENPKNNETIKKSYDYEYEDKIDFLSNYNLDKNIIDFYSYHPTNFNFLDKKLFKIKINNYESDFKNNLPINLIYYNSEIYSLNSKGDILKFNIENGKLIERYSIDLPIENKIPVSFSLFNSNFIIGYKSGDVIKTDTKGKIVWSYKNKNLLNTPIKHYNNNLIILYPEDIIILSSESGKVVFEKNYKSNNIIQSNGGKIISYFNFIYFILPNSEFHSIDTFLFDDNLSKLQNIELVTSLNNLNDNISIYNNLFSYLDNSNIIYTYDLINNKFLLSKFIINNNNSSIFYNNSLITKNEKILEFYNIKNGKLFANVNIEKIFKKNSKIIHSIVIDNKLHLFTDTGKVLILDEYFAINDLIDLKIKKINKIYNYQEKLFVSTEKGITYIF